MHASLPWILVLAACGAGGAPVSPRPSDAIAPAAGVRDAGVAAADSADADVLALAAGGPVRVVTVSTQPWGCCGVAPFIAASHPVGGPDDAYLLPVPRPGVADPEPARRPGQRMALWGRLRRDRATVRAWLAERGRPAPSEPDALANLGKSHPVLDVDAWCVIGGVGPTACLTAYADEPALVPEPAPAPASLGSAHPVVAGEPGAWTVAATPTDKGERVTLRGPRERGVTLELALELSHHDDAGAATRALAKLRAAADPNTGLSYGWDLVERRGARVVRLHGGCRWSEARWQAAVARLRAWLGPAEDAFACRCGGGCAAAP